MAVRIVSLSIEIQEHLGRTEKGARPWPKLCSLSSNEKVTTYCVFQIKYARGAVTITLVPAEDARALCTLTGMVRLVTEAEGGEWPSEATACGDMGEIGGE